MGIRDKTYYAWETLELYGNDIITEAGYNDFAIDSSGSYYVVGWHYDTSQAISTPNQAKYKWIVKKSTDKGKTWTFCEQITGSRPDGVGYPTANQANSICIDPEDRILVAGWLGSDIQNGTDLVVRRSTDRGSTWQTVYTTGSYPTNANGGASRVCVTSGSDRMYYVGGWVYNATNFSLAWVVASSSNGASGSWKPNWYLNTGFYDSAVYDLHACNFGGAGYVFAIGEEKSGGTLIRKSSDFGKTWESVYYSIHPGFNGPGDYWRQAKIRIVPDVDEPHSNFYVAAVQTSGSSDFITLLQSGTPSFGGSGSFTRSFSASTDFTQANGLDFDAASDLYLGQQDIPVGSNNLMGMYYVQSGSFASEVVDKFLLINTDFDPCISNIYVDKRPNKSADEKGHVFVVGSTSATDQGRAYIRRGKRTANSASIGPSMLATSIGYVAANEVENSGSTLEAFKLMNVSEFPHVGGFYQMRNIILGTIDSGKIGKDEDAIIQVNYFGSVVKVLWPKQDDQTVPVKGFGDVSFGQRIGKLSTNFEPGDEIDVTEFDHLALYCYLRKEVSGTLDDVEIKIERRPLKSTGYATEQAVEYQSSGSYTVAKLTDVVYKKSIDYGDLSIREIGFPIDVPLTNIREVRLSARHANGQAEENKNFIIWGRLIKSDEET